MQFYLPLLVISKGVSKFIVICLFSDKTDTNNACSVLEHNKVSELRKVSVTRGTKGRHWKSTSVPRACINTLLESDLRWTNIGWEKNRWQEVDFRSSLLLAVCPGYKRQIDVVLRTNQLCSFCERAGNLVFKDVEHAENFGCNCQKTTASKQNLGNCKLLTPNLGQISNIKAIVFSA